MRIFNFIVLFFISISAFAEDNSNVVIETKNGEKLEFSIGKDNPRIVYLDGVVRIENASFSSEYNMIDVKKMYFSSQTPSSIKYENVERFKLKTAKGFTMFKLKSNEKVIINDLSGKVIKQTNADSEGTIRLNFDMIATGVYVVKTETYSFKILNR